MYAGYTLEGLRATRELLRSRMQACIQDKRPGWEAAVQTRACQIAEIDRVIERKEVMNN